MVTFGRIKDNEPEALAGHERRRAWRLLPGALAKARVVSRARSPPLRRPAPRRTSGHYDRGVPDCLFCGIAAGQIPATIVLDGKRIVAFRDINPQAPTHVLVVPRDHFPDVAALAAGGGGLLDELVGTAREIAAAEGIEATGYRIVFNTGQDGGQTVGHVHAHLLGGRPMTWPPG
jgi:histidine triad (HIT) family protein